MLSLQVNFDKMGFVHSVLALGDVGPINLNEVVTFEKFEHESTKEALGRYQIMLIINEGGINPKKYFWKYRSKCDRDKDYEALKVKISTALT